MFFLHAVECDVLLSFWQYKRDAVEAAVREIAHDRQTFAEGRKEAIVRIGEQVPFSSSVFSSLLLSRGRSTPADTACRLSIFSCRTARHSCSPVGARTCCASQMRHVRIRRSGSTFSTMSPADASGQFHFVGPIFVQIVNSSGESLDFTHFPAALRSGGNKEVE